MRLCRWASTGHSVSRFRAEPSGHLGITSVGCPRRLTLWKRTRREFLDEQRPNDGAWSSQACSRNGYVPTVTRPRPSCVSLFEVAPPNRLLRQSHLPCGAADARPARL